MAPRRPKPTQKHVQPDRWAFREGQARQIRRGLASSAAGPLFLTGGAWTGKATQLRFALQDVAAHVTTVDCVISHSDRLLFSAIACKTLTADPHAFLSHMQQHPSDDTNSSISAIVFLRAERLRGQHFSTTALAVIFRLIQLSHRSDLRLIFVSSIPWSLFREHLSYDIPQPTIVYFPPYTEEEVVQAITALYEHSEIFSSNPDCNANEPPIDPQSAQRMYKGYVQLVVSILYAATTDLRELQSVCTDLYPRYLTTPLDSSNTDPAFIATTRFNRIQDDLKHALRQLYRRELYIPRATQLQSDSSAPDAVHSPFATPQQQIARMDLSRSTLFLLVAAFLSSRNPPTHDMRYFTPESMRKRRGRGRGRGGGRGRRAARAGSAIREKISGAHMNRVFPLERLLAVFEAIQDEMNHDSSQGVASVSAAISTSSQVQISTLVSLNYLTKDGAGDPLAEPKYRCNISEEMANNVARLLNLELDQYLHKD